MNFTPFPKIPRLRREITITEKIDGSNAQVMIERNDSADYPDASVIATIYIDEPSSDGCGGIEGIMSVPHFIRAGSRSRWITPGKSTDNFGFAQWVLDNAEELVKLGVGTHFGEWWGHGIQRGYGLDEKRFSLFNTARPADTLPDCVSQVPLLYRGIDDGSAVENALTGLRSFGSSAAPGFMKPEGIVVYHSAARSRFKVLLENDDIPKGNQ